MTTNSISTCTLNGFSDSACDPEQWKELLCAHSKVVFLTWHWQRAWWECFGCGQLLLIAAMRENQIVAIAPLFAEEGMVFFVGSGGSDYLDFIGDVSDPDVLMTLLETARSTVPNFVGFRFYLVPDSSPTGRRLQEAAARLNLECYDEGDLPAPALDLATSPEIALAATRKKSLLRHERYFEREGSLEVVHLTNGEEILPHLDEFFDQHVARWTATPYPSLFCDTTQREFYRHLTQVAGNTGWLRFCRINWNGRPIAFHFGFCYQGSYLWYKPSFDIHLARYSPGEVLLRQLLLAAIDEGAHTFDFGLGDEPFKRRFATNVTPARTWGLYPQ